jgi:hypothetical protein
MRCRPTVSARWANPLWSRRLAVSQNRSDSPNAFDRRSAVSVVMLRLLWMTSLGRATSVLRPLSLSGRHRVSVDKTPESRVCLPKEITTIVVYIPRNVANITIVVDGR